MPPRRAPAIHRHRQLINNPAAAAWVRRTLGESYELMQESVPPGYLPKLTDVESAGSALVGRAETYGCGTYGCVYPTLTPDIVLKVTSDDTEAEFARNHANTLVAPICVDYQAVIELDRQYRGSSIYLLWRESADHVGKLAEVVGSEASNLVNDQWDAAQPVFQNLHNHVPYTWELQEWLSACANLRDSAYPALQQLGAGLLEVWQAQHIFFGDIHTGNLGLVHRPEGDRWVITDPGHIAVITTQQAALPIPPRKNPSARHRRNGGGDDFKLEVRQAFGGQEFRALGRGEATVWCDTQEDAAGRLYELLGREVPLDTIANRLGVGATLRAPSVRPLRHDECEMETAKFDGIDWHRARARGLSSVWCYTPGEALLQVQGLVDGTVTSAGTAGRLQPEEIEYHFLRVDEVRWAEAVARGESSGWCKASYAHAPSSKLIRIPPLERLLQWFEGQEISEAPPGQLSVPQMEALNAALQGVGGVHSAPMKKWLGTAIPGDVEQALQHGINTQAWLRVSPYLTADNFQLYGDAKIAEVPAGPRMRRQGAFRSNGAARAGARVTPAIRLKLLELREEAPDIMSDAAAARLIARIDAALTTGVLDAQTEDTLSLM